MIAGTQTTQPTWTSDGSLCVTVLGEIHNCPELRQRLERQGRSISSGADAELVATLFQEKGQEFVRDLDGLFIVAVWDHNEQKLTLAQDRYGGIRQLYYAALPNALVFASGIRPILASGKLTSAVDEQALVEFFAIGSVPPPHTMFRGVKKLVPGYALTCGQGSVSTRRVHGFSFSPQIDRKELPRFGEHHAEAVRKRLASDRPVGLLLSGGLDSSLNVAVASRVAEKPISTFSVRFLESGLDESPYSDLVASRFGTDHHQLTLDSSDSLEILPQVVWCQEEPLWDASALPSLHLARFAKSHVDAVIAGDGPDHLFGRYYNLAAKRRLIGGVPGGRCLSRLLTENLDNGFSRFRPLATAQKLAHAARASSTEEAYREMILGFYLWGSPATEVASRVFSGALKNAEYNERFDESIFAPDDVTSEFSRLVACDFMLDGSMGVFSKFGKVAAGHSLLVREPYFDNTLVDYINRLPEGLKVKGNLWQLLRGAGETKYIMRHTTCREVLPPAVLAKPKHGFVPPLVRWLRETLQQLTPAAALAKSINRAGYFDNAYVEAVIREHLSTAPDRREVVLALYLMLSFAVWHRLHIERLAISYPTETLTELLRD